MAICYSEVMTDWQAFAHLPDEAQLWVFGFKDPLGDREKAVIRQTLETFMPQWSSHGAPVECGFEIVHDRFVLVAAISSDGVSGCSIDSCVRQFKFLRETHGLNGLEHSLVFFRAQDGSIQSSPFLRFRDLTESGGVTVRTPVFDTTIVKLGELRSGRFELDFQHSWHARSFPLPAVAE